MIRTLLSCLLALACYGCGGIPVPLQGQMQGSAEPFTGKAEGSIDGGGTLRIVSARGTVCAGNFVFDGVLTGMGILNCTDGRSGPFQFTARGGLGGEGQGKLGGEPFSFKFGY